MKDLYDEINYVKGETGFLWLTVCVLVFVSVVFGTIMLNDINAMEAKQTALECEMLFMWNESGGDVGRPDWRGNLEGLCE